MCAALVPRMGGAERLIISINSLLVVPLFAPTLWGLFSRKIGLRHMLWVAFSSFVLGALFKFQLLEHPLVSNFQSLKFLSDYARNHPKNMEVIIGVIFPVLMLCLLEWHASTHDQGWAKVENRRREYEAQLDAVFHLGPTLIMG